MNFTNRTIPASFLALPLLATGLFATACSRGGGGAAPIRQPEVSATASLVTADPTSGLAADGTTVSQITVIVLDTTGAPLANQTVALDVSGNGNVLTPASGSSDPQGRFRATLASTSAERKEIVARVNPGTPAPVTLATRAEVVFLTPDTPVLGTLARYEDTNRNGVADQGDRLTLGFSVPVLVVASRPEDLALPVAGDSLGVGASVFAGPLTHEATVVLGTSPVLRTRGAFAAASVAANSPSGIAVAAGALGVVSASTNTPAAPSAAVDIVPALHAQAQATTLSDAVTIATGDLDNDGDVDVWVAGNGADRVLLRDASGALVDGGQFGGQATRAVAIADLDRFGAQDIVTAHEGTTQIWLNRTTTAPLSITTGVALASGSTRALAVADIDGDGFRDVITGSTTDVRVFVNGRNLGVSMQLTQTLAVTDVTALVVTDVDGDGDADVLAGTTAGLRLLRNNSGALAIVTLDALAASSLAVGDVDADADLDVVASDGSATRLLRNEGNGAFTASALPIPAERVVLGDLDGDARADLVTMEAAAIAVHFAIGSGFVRDAQRFDDAGRSAILTDCDRDGDLDLLAVLTSELRTRTGSLRGTFGSTTLVTDGAQAPGVSNATALGDLDGDGDDDLVVGGDGDDLVLRNDGNGSFTFSGLTRHRLGSGSTSAVAIADMDGDGDLDVVTVERFVAGVTSRWRAWFNDGNGGFVQTLDLPHAQTDDARAVALGDVIDDGSVDVIVGCNGKNLVFRNVLLNGQRTFFQAPDAFPAATNDRDTRALAMFDIDEDGDLDLVVGNFGDPQFGQANQVFRLAVVNNLPVFSEFTLLGTEPTVAVAVGDFDGDSLIDLVCANSDNGGTFQHRIHSFGRRSTSAVGQAIRFTSGSPATSMAVGDIDGDGRVDLVMSTTDGKVQVWRQTAALQFAVAQELLLNDVRALAAGDFDRDGDVDAFAATGANDLVLRNR